MPSTRQAIERLRLRENVGRRRRNGVETAIDTLMFAQAADRTAE